MDIKNIKETTIYVSKEIVRNDRTRDLIPRHVLEPSEVFHFRGSTQIHEKTSHYLNFEQFLQLDCTETTFG